MFGLDQTFLNMESKGNSWQAWSKSLECCEQKHNGMKSFLKEYYKVHIYWEGYTNLKQSPNLITGSSDKGTSFKFWIYEFFYRYFSVLSNWKINETFFCLSLADKKQHHKYYVIFHVKIRRLGIRDSWFYLMSSSLVNPFIIRQLRTKSASGNCSFLELTGFILWNNTPNFSIVNS